MIKSSKIHIPPLYILIPTIFTAIIMILPLLYLITRSIEASADTWISLFSIRSLQTLGRSLLLMSTVTLMSLIIAIPLAWCTARTNLPMRKIWTILVILPLVMPSFIAAFLFTSALGPKGLLQNLLEKPFGVKELPGLEGLIGATIVLALLSYPYIFLAIRGSINNIDPSIEESAKALGKNSLKVFTTITLPHIKPALIAGSLFVALYTLSDFGAVSMMRYNTFTWTIYQQYGSVIDRSASAALSIALVSTALIILILEQNIRGKEKNHRIGSGSSRKPKIINLGFWKYPITSFFVLIISAALIIPVSILVFWLFRGILNGESITLSLSTVLNSVIVSLIATLTTALLALVTAVKLIRYPSIMNRFMEPISFIGYALPGVVVGIALVFFGTRFAMPIYQSIFLLIIGYIILFFPVSLGIIRSSLMQINPRIEESAMSLKHNALSVLTKITIPLIKSGLLMSLSMVFLLTLKELPATLILGPLNFHTLATQVWSYSSEAYFAKSAFPSLLIIVLSIFPLTTIIWHDKRIYQ